MDWIPNHGPLAKRQCVEPSRNISDMPRDVWKRSRRGVSMIPRKIRLLHIWSETGVWMLAVSGDPPSGALGLDSRLLAARRLWVARSPEEKR